MGPMGATDTGTRSTHWWALPHGAHQVLERLATEQETWKSLACAGLEEGNRSCCGKGSKLPWSFYSFSSIGEKKKKGFKSARETTHVTSGHMWRPMKARKREHKTKHLYSWGKSREISWTQIIREPSLEERQDQYPPTPPPHALPCQGIYLPKMEALPGL